MGLRALAAAMLVLPIRRRPCTAYLAITYRNLMSSSPISGPQPSYTSQRVLSDEADAPPASQAHLASTRAAPSASLTPLQDLRIARGAKPASFHANNRAGRRLAGEQQAQLIINAGKVGLCPEGERPATFNNVLSEIWQLPPGYRAQPLECVARQIRFLPIVHRDAAFKSVTHAVERLSSQIRIETFLVLTEQVGKLPQDKRLPAIANVIARAAQLPDEHKAQVLAELARQCDKPAKVASAVFDSVLAAVARLPAEYRALPLERLAERLVKLPQKNRSAIFGSLVDMAAALPDESSARALKAVSSALGSLRPDEQSTAFVRVFNAIGQLSPAERSQPLAALADWLLRNRKVELPDAERFAVAIVSLAVERETVLDSFESVLDLLSVLPEGRRQEAFSHAFNAVKRLPAGESHYPLRRLTARIRDLPESLRPTAFDQVIGRVEFLSDEAAGNVLLFLGSEISSLPATDQFAALRKFIGCCERLPYDRSTATRGVRSLVDYLPDNEQQTARELLGAHGIFWPSAVRG